MEERSPAMASHIIPSRYLSIMKICPRTVILKLYIDGRPPFRFPFLTGVEVDVFEG